MAVQVDVDERLAKFKVIGNLDLELGEVIRDKAGELGEEAKTFVLDVSGMNYNDSSGMG